MVFVLAEHRLLVSCLIVVAAPAATRRLAAKADSAMGYFAALARLFLLDASPIIFRGMD
jgi:hypothetical protein